MKKSPEYSDIYTKLCYQLAILVFFKRNGNIRTMLATRNSDIMNSVYGDKQVRSKLNSHDNRCSIKNGNVAVIDMEIGEARSFNIDRLVSAEFMDIKDTNELVNAYDKFKQFKRKYDKEYDKLKDTDNYINVDEVFK